MNGVVQAKVLVSRLPAKFGPDTSMGGYPVNQELYRIG